MSKIKSYLMEQLEEHGVNYPYELPSQRVKKIEVKFKGGVAVAEFRTGQLHGLKYNPATMKVELTSPATFSVAWKEY